MKSFFLITLFTISSLQAEVRGWWDIAPREYPELEFSYRQVVPENNSLADIAANMERLSTIDEHQEWRAAHTRNIVHISSKQLRITHKESLDQLRESLLKDIQSDGEISISASFSKEMSLVSAANLLAYSADDSVFSGKNDLAISQLQLLQNLSNKAMMTDGGLVNYLVATTCYFQSYATAVNLGAAPNLSTDQVKKISSIVGQSFDTKPRFKNAIACEYQFLKQCLFSIYTSEIISRTAPISTLKPRFLREYIHRVILGNLLQPNKTLELAAKSYIAAQNGDNPPKRQSATLIKEGLYLSSNAIGLALLDSSVEVVLNKNQSVKLETQQNLVSTYLAIRLYMLQYQTLPERLQDLTPRFIEKVPLDPYSGHPLQYSKEDKRIWSIGEDKKDNKGVSEASLKKAAKEKSKKRKKKKRKKKKRMKQRISDPEQKVIYRIDHAQHLSDNDEPHIVIPF